MTQKNITYNDDTEKEQIVSSKKAEGLRLVGQQNNIIGKDLDGNNVFEKKLIFTDEDEPVRRLSNEERLDLIEERLDALESV
ncbi:MAG: hypothetical protein KAS32_15630 [Candidatus Peribacteraceae bacterium]|nr:hypothetical protein [Candidatus Peribacteraceae bacterium]